MWQIRFRCPSVCHSVLTFLFHIRWSEESSWSCRVLSITSSLTALRYHAQVYYISHDALPQCLKSKASSSSALLPVLCNADGWPSSLPDAVTSHSWGDGATLYQLQLEAFVCRGGGESDLHCIRIGAWRTHIDLCSEDKARTKGCCREEATRGGTYMINTKHTNTYQT